MSAPDRVTLRDGATLLIRPVEADDKDAIVAGFERLSAESRYRRFFSPLARLSDRDLAYLTEVDHHDHEALIAFDEEGEPLGVARYIRTGGADAAEVAVVVVDHWQGRGVATALLAKLSDRARDEGVRTFTATILTENRDAIALMRTIGEARRVGPASTTVTMEIPIPRTGVATRLRETLRQAAAGMVSGRDPSHPRTRLRRRG